MFESLWTWIYDLGISLTVRESSWAFPTLECIHLYSMVFLIGIVSAFDLRLMGISVEDQPISHYSKLVRRWVWIPLGVNTITGTLLFMSKPMEYSANFAFITKMVFLFLGLPRRDRQQGTSVEQSRRDACGRQVIRCCLTGLLARHPGFIALDRIRRLKLYV